MHLNNWRDKEHNTESIWSYYSDAGRWSGSAMVLGKLSVPGGPTDLVNGRARAYRTCSRYR